MSVLLVASDQGQVSGLCLLDLTAAFDTVDHELLLQRLDNTFGVRDQAKEWFKSYLTGRSYCVIHGGRTSATVLVTGWARRARSWALNCSFCTRRNWRTSRQSTVQTTTSYMSIASSAMCCRQWRCWNSASRRSSSGCQPTGWNSTPTKPNWCGPAPSTPSSVSCMTETWLWRLEPTLWRCVFWTFSLHRTSHLRSTQRRLAPSVSNCVSCDEYDTHLTVTVQLH